MRSTPVFFLQDDHDYFDNDEGTDVIVTFPPPWFQMQLARATQQQRRHSAASGAPPSTIGSRVAAEMASSSLRFLMPVKNSASIPVASYALARAMEEAGKVALGRFVMRNATIIAAFVYHAANREDREPDGGGHARERVNAGDRAVDVVVQVFQLVDHHVGDQVRPGGQYLPQFDVERPHPLQRGPHRSRPPPRLLLTMSISPRQLVGGEVACDRCQQPRAAAVIFGAAQVGIPVSTVLKKVHLYVSNINPDGWGAGGTASSHRPVALYLNT